ncbi:hypothetical protein SAMN06265370_12037 [Puniceibacterium sediminis]|uniref:Penicillin binding protein transpeptidase domain-containing protein n=2 Tax=Puniceibacterium sediminis TaxID=1608407 RepID=A0A238YVA9_9RHOB|nr:hypothetical protein SAMN06265370_12037 [Puniceibacterium sediminis]
MKPDRIRLLVASAGVVLVLVGIGAFSYIAGTFKRNAEWVGAAQSVGAAAVPKLLENLHEDLVDVGIIKARRTPDRLSIWHPPCSAMVREDAGIIDPPQEQLRNATDPRALRKKHARLLRVLCITDVGEQLREEIASFNAGQALIGIRDNRAARSQPVLCEDGDDPGAFISPGCLPGKWNARHKASGVPLDTGGHAAISLRSYVVLANAQRRAMADWVTLETVAHGSNSYIFKTDLGPVAGPVEVDVIGRVTAVIIDGARHDVDQSGAIISGGAGQGLSRVTAVCADTRNTEIACKAGDAEQDRIGMRLSLRAAQSAQPQDIAVEIKPQPLRVETLLRNARRSTKGRIVGNGLIALNCTLAWPAEAAGFGEGPVATGCDVVWNRSGSGSGGSSREPKPFRMIARQTGVFDSKGGLTSDAYALGLANLMGFGITDPGSLASKLARTANPSSQPYQLTVRPSFQMGLQKAIRDQWPGIDSPPGKRRATFVVLDAEGPDAGALLGFGTMPGAAYGLSHWDVLALQTAAPGKAPAPAHAWRRHDQLSTPGSSFKMLTALAAMQAVLDGHPDARQIEDLLLGRLSVNKAEAFLGLGRGGFHGARCSSGKAGRDCCARPQMRDAFVLAVPRVGLPPRCIGNFNVATNLGTSWNAGPGVVGALDTSSNLFFAGLALRMDRGGLEDANGRIHDKDAHDLAMARMARKLFGDLGPTRPSEFDPLSPTFTLDKVRLGQIPRWAPSPIGIEATIAAKGEPRLQQLAFSGMGQNVQATPLAMASIAASIATNRVVTPWVLSRAGGAPPARGPEMALLDIPVGKDAQAAVLLEKLTDGLNASVSNAMVKGLPHLRPTAHFKTGTADLDGDNRNTVWTVGFIRPPQGRASGIDQTYAIACNIGPVSGTSAICAAAIPRILKLLDDGVHLRDN